MTDKIHDFIASADYAVSAASGGKLVVSRGIAPLLAALITTTEER